MKNIDLDDNLFKIKGKLLTKILNQETIITEQFLKLKGLDLNINEYKNITDQIKIKYKQLSKVQNEIAEIDILKINKSEIITLNNNIAKSQKYINEIDELLLKYNLKN